MVRTVLLTFVLSQDAEIVMKQLSPTICLSSARESPEVDEMIRLGLVDRLCASVSEIRPTLTITLPASGPEDPPLVSDHMS